MQRDHPAARSKSSRRTRRSHKPFGLAPRYVDAWLLWERCVQRDHPAASSKTSRRTRRSHKRFGLASRYVDFFANESRKVTVRLNTGAPARWSLRSVTK